MTILELTESFKTMNTVVRATRWVEITRSPPGMKLLAKGATGAV